MHSLTSWPHVSAGTTCCKSLEIAQANGATRSSRLLASSSFDRGQSRLIIPGGGDRSQRNNSSSNRLVVPGVSDSSTCSPVLSRTLSVQQVQPPLALGALGEMRLSTGQERASKGASIDTSGIPAPTTSRFRPPPGFMDADNVTQDTRPLEQAEAKSVLERLQASAGLWHEQAKELPRLYAAGYDSAVVEVETGLERAVQNIWMVASQVYESLKKPGGVAAEELAYFSDDSTGAEMLYHLRFLPVAVRPSVASYIVKQHLNPAEAGVLARSVKEQERRDGGKEGFTTSPADCLAFKYYRDAIESRREHQRADLIRKGLSVAESPSATAALEALIADKPPQPVGAGEAKQAVLEVIRLTGEEVEFRPMPLVGELEATSPSQVAAAVGVSQAGMYNAFHMPQEATGQQFVALPAFRSLLIARSPVALSVPDCSAQPAVLKAANATKEEDIQRQAGPGLVVLDRQVDSEERDPLAFYVKAEGSGCALVEGSRLTTGENVAGRVLFVCRPHARSATPKMDSYALMSV